MDKQNVIYPHTMEYYLAMKKNKILIYAITQMDLENIMLNEKADTRDLILYISIYKKFQNRQTYRYRKYRLVAV